MKKLCLVILSVAIVYTTQAQQNTAKDLPLTRQGAMFGFWGWNREVYTPSNIHFIGDHYNFTLHNVVAHDRQTPVDLGIYLHPLKLTVPQTNLQVGYFIKDNLAIVLSVDHMKYVMDQNQVANFSGEINDPKYTKYADMVHNGRVDLADKKFLTLNHTNGLNYVNVGVEKYHSIYSINWFDINWAYGAGIGFLVPKSDVQLFENPESDRFHLAGFGFDARTNFNLLFWKHILLRVELKAGYINMPDIMTTLHNKPDKAKQDFGFIQLNFGVGYFFQTKTKIKKKK